MFLALNEQWKIHDFDMGQGEHSGAALTDYDDAAWLPASVPGDVHSSLLALGKIPDPFYADQVERVQWVADREWWYRGHFRPDAPTAAHMRYFLVFDGLDLFATIYLNGKRIGDHANMFRPAEFDVTDQLQFGADNLIAVCFDPMRQHISGEKHAVQLAQFDSDTRVQVRKTQAQFMWDHTPACLMVGLWQGVHLDRFEGARLRSPHFRVLSLDAEQAVISVDAAIEHWAPETTFEVDVTLTLQAAFVRPDQDRPQAFHASAAVRNDKGRVVLTIPDPVLWWTNGLGQPALYDLQVRLRAGDQVLDEYAEAVGIRTITVDHTPDPDEVGTDFFTFVLNGRPVFIKGSNWVPTDLLNGRVSTHDYDEWFSLLREANGNMMRVWGGGQYEPDAFYQAADRMGILIWHDFMFACATYPDHVPNFVEEVRLEAEFQVKRLRNHPAMAIWVGNNELDWLLDHIQWQTPGKHYPGWTIGHQLLPAIVHQFDPDRFYWPSSPYGGNDHNSDQAGDRHNWQTWHAMGARKFGDPASPVMVPPPEGAPVITPGMISYRHLGSDMGRFISEYGIHGAPVLETFRRNIPAEHLRYGDPAIRFRDRNQKGGRGELMLQAHLRLPETLEDYIDFSMMVQAEGLKYGIEHHRRRKFHCSGTMFWQWNDNWPGITWSVLDYYRFPKASYFFVKRAFAPVIISIREEPGGGYTIWGSNDTLSDAHDVLHCDHLTFEGKVISHSDQPITIPANSSVPLLRLDQAAFKTSHPGAEMIWVHAEHGSFPDNRYFLVELRDLVRQRSEVRADWEVVAENRVRVRLCAEQHAYFVNVFVPLQDTRYSDNWVDLFPNQDREIEIWHPEGKAITPEMVALRWY